jgi:hypothetical protein
MPREPTALPLGPAASVHEYAERLTSRDVGTDPFGLRERIADAGRIARHDDRPAGRMTLLADV